MKRYSLHKIHSEDKIPFSATDYSKFKFGDKDIARDFGYALADGYIKDRLMYMDDLKIVVISSPYCFIPTATFAMKDYFVQRINMWLAETGHPVVEETKIHRTITYKEDYGALSAEERINLIGKDGFHIDKSFVDGKMLMFLDDIIITGSHENVVKRMLKEYKINAAFEFLYFAELENKSIHPKIENDLNFAFVKDLYTLDKVIKNESFLFNTRVVKFMLNAPASEFSTFIRFQKEAFLQTFIHLAIGNSYHTIPDYHFNFTTLKNYLKTF